MNLTNEIYKRPVNKMTGLFKKFTNAYYSIFHNGRF